MNVIEPVTPLNLDCGTFGDLVDTMFVLSFISIGLTGSQKAKKEADGTKQTGPVLGGTGMGIIWCFLYGLTPVIGGILIFIIGRAVGMSGWYGILIPFGFCQGPGQASTYGRLFENVYGFENAEMVALTFAVVLYRAALRLSRCADYAGGFQNHRLRKNFNQQLVQSGTHQVFPEKQRQPHSEGLFGGVLLLYLLSHRHPQIAVAHPHPARLFKLAENP